MFSTSKNVGKFSCYIPPDLAKKIYIQVSKLGKESELDGLSNQDLPIKFEKALEILGIHCDKIGFRDYNGYIILTDMMNYNKIRKIACTPLQDVTFEENKRLRHEPKNAFAALDDFIKDIEGPSGRAPWCPYKHFYKK